MNESETPNGPRFASALSTEADTSEAIGQAFRRAGEETVELDFGIDPHAPLPPMRVIG